MYKHCIVVRYLVLSDLDSCQNKFVLPYFELKNVEKESHKSNFKVFILLHHIFRNMTTCHKHFICNACGCLKLETVMLYWWATEAIS